MPGAELRWLCDRRPAARERAELRYPHVATTPRLDDLLDDARVDAIVVATPVSTHYELARRTLEAGKHVFVEKPPAMRGAEMEELCELAEERNLVLMPGHLLHRDEREPAGDRGGRPRPLSEIGREHEQHDRDDAEEHGHVAAPAEGLAANEPPVVVPRDEDGVVGSGADEVLLPGLVVLADHVAAGRDSAGEVRVLDGDPRIDERDPYPVAPVSRRQPMA